MSNESALEFYRKFGFENVDTVENYYKRIEPADAYVLEKKLQHHKVESDNGAKSNEVNGESAPAIVHNGTS